MEIKELTQYIDPKDFQDQNEWLFIANVFKAAELDEADFDEWCQLDPEKYDTDVIDRYRSLSPMEDAEHAKNTLLMIARENGYTYQGKFEHLPSVALRPCFRIANKPHDEQMPEFDTRKARADAMKILQQLTCNSVMVANYIEEDTKNWDFKTRPKQEASYELPLSSLNVENGGKFLEMEQLQCGCAFLLNKVDVEKLQKDREAGTTKGVKEEHFVSYNWCLIESDMGTIEEQWDKILSLDLPLLAIVHSGNKSLHCFCHVGANSLEEYKQRTDMLIRYCLANSFNVDTATKNINRWVRFPYAKRKANRQYPVKVFEKYKTFNQWKREAVYYADIFDRTVIKKGKDEKGPPQVQIVINLNSMMNVLWQNGFRRNIAGNIFYKVEGKVVRKTTEGEVHTFLYDWIKTYYPEDLNTFARSKWEPTRLRGLDSIPDERHTDSKDESFFYFTNAAIKVTSLGIEKVSYMDAPGVKKVSRKSPWDYMHVRTFLEKTTIPGLNGYIDAKQIINHKLMFSDEEGDFSRFVAMICNHDQERIKALMSALGYLMHRYKNPSRVKAVVLTDESLTDENGGTGKGLLFQALKQVRFCQAADMKTREQNRFFFSTVERGCSIFHMDDVQNGFDFNRLFNVLAGDMEVEPKGVNRTIIPFEEAPKIYMSTNFAFKDMEKDSYRRRMAVYELHRKFTADYQPIDEFGHSFFYDWDKEEWNRFYNFMLQCSWVYMRSGLLECEAKFAKEKSLRAEFQGKEDFLDFIQSWEAEGLLDKQITNEELNKRWHDEKGIEVTPARLKKLLNRYCELQGYKIDSPRTAKTKSFFITKPDK